MDIILNMILILIAMAGVLYLIKQVIGLVKDLSVLINHARLQMFANAGYKVSVFESFSLQAAKNALRDKESVYLLTTHLDWCNDNFDRLAWVMDDPIRSINPDTSYFESKVTFRFVNEEDAMAFKLRWT